MVHAPLFPSKISYIKDDAIKIDYPRLEIPIIKSFCLSYKSKTEQSITPMMLFLMIPNLNALASLPRNDPCSCNSSHKENFRRRCS